VLLKEYSSDWALLYGWAALRDIPWPWGFDHR
jgi:hypothetical protein